MLPAALTLAAGLTALTAALTLDALGWAGLLALWTVLGIATGAILTPTGRLVTASSAPNDRPAAFAAQFSLSHGWFLITYPVAGWLAARVDMATAATALAAVAVTAAVTGFACWPKRDAVAIAHVHAELGPDHPHLATRSPPRTVGATSTSSSSTVCTGIGRQADRNAPEATTFRGRRSYITVCADRETCAFSKAPPH